MSQEIQIRQTTGYPGYFISSCGKFFSIKSGYLKQIKTQKNPDGYLKAVLCLDGERKDTSAHRLVASAWLDKPEGKTQVNHKDGDKENNRASNLEWVTIQENNHHAVNVLGVRRGEKNYHAKLTDDQVRAIRKDKRTLHAIAADHYVYFSTIHKIKTRESWRHVKDDESQA